MLGLAERVKSLEALHGGLRSAARSTGIDVSYLKRLRDGDKTNPSDETLDKLGLKKVVIYVLK